MILGISVDGTDAQGVLIDPDGHVGARARSDRAPEAAHAISDVATKLLASASGAPPTAVGVSFPDPDPQSWPADFTSLAGIAGRDVPVRIVSTGNAAALAEVWYGSARGARDLIAFSLGTSVSAGIISNGVLLAGAHGLASSVRWFALNPVEREDYRRLGCLEAEAGAAGIVRRLVSRVKTGDTSSVMDSVGGDYGAIHLEDILKAGGEGDGVSNSVLRDTVRYLAMAVANIAAVIDPEVIVLGGIICSSGDLLFEPIRQECARRMPPAIFDRVRIDVSTLGSDAAPIGAARYAQFGNALP